MQGAINKCMGKPSRGSTSCISTCCGPSHPRSETLICAGTPPSVPGNSAALPASLGSAFATRSRVTETDGRLPACARLRHPHCHAPAAAGSAGSHGHPGSAPAPQAAAADGGSSGGAACHRCPEKGLHLLYRHDWAELRAGPCRVLRDVVRVSGAAGQREPHPCAGWGCAPLCTAPSSPRPRLPAAPPPHACIAFPPPNHRLHRRKNAEPPRRCFPPAIPTQHPPAPLPLPRLPPPAPSAGPAR